jgi:hypothetical protein
MRLLSLLLAAGTSYVVISQGNTTAAQWQSVIPTMAQAITNSVLAQIRFVFTAAARLLAQQQ